MPFCKPINLNQGGFPNDGIQHMEDTIRRSGNALPVPSGTVGSRSAEAEGKSSSKNTKRMKDDSANSGSSAVKDGDKDKIIADLLAQLNQAP